MKRTKKSQKKTKFLLILIVLTAILSITATYAWFSSQRDVEIVGMKINVEVAESMQISLDGDHWVNSIQIDNMRQFYGTYGVTTAHQANTANTNYVPTELLPVSTVGAVDNGKLQFMIQDETATAALTNGGIVLKACSESDLTTTATVSEKETKNADHPYLVFDMYLRNYSAKEGGDNLLLNTGSRVWVDTTTAETVEGTGKLDTGLENCARVAFIPYSNTADTTATGDTIRALAAGGSETAAIWEPNDKDHITEVINNSGRGVTADTTMPTYGVKFAETAVTVEDIEDTDDELLGEQKTMKPAYAAATGTTAQMQLTSTPLGVGETEENTTGQMKLGQNTITKVRVYIWLEGQDVDCINTASMGDRLQVNLKLTKPTNEGGGVSYVGDGTGTGTEAGE